MNPNRRKALLAGGGAAVLAACAGLVASQASRRLPRRIRRRLRFDAAEVAHSGYQMRIVDASRFLAESAPWDHAPTEYIPPSLRKPNRDGSCVHLTTRNLLLAHGLYREAKAWTHAYRGGEYASRHSQRLTEMGIRFAVETGGDARFLDWACGNLGGAHRGAGITLLGAHVLNLIDLDPESLPDPKAKWLNNWVSNFDDANATVWPRQRLITEWRRRGGWAFSIICTDDGRGSPPPPVPWVDPNSPYSQERQSR